MRIASLLPIAGLLLVGCVDDSGPALYIEGNVAPNDECVVSKDNALVASGVVNVDLAREYEIHPRYANQLFQNASAAPLRPDPNGMLVQGAEVEILDAAGGTVDFGALPNPFTVRNTAFVPSGEGPGSRGTEVGVLRIIPGIYLDALQGFPGDEFQLLVDVNAFGETLGHIPVDAREFVWPVDVCRGNCLVDFAATEGTCCQLGQDFAKPVSCFPGLSAP